MNRQEKIKYLISHPEEILKFKPFTRGRNFDNMRINNVVVNTNEKVSAYIPMQEKYVVDMEQFLRELDPNCHIVLFDESVPSISVKTKGGYREIDFRRLSIPFQKIIKDKQVLHLCGNKMNFTLVETNPTKRQEEMFTTFKQYWDLRNQDGVRTAFVDAQLSVGIAGQLFYFDSKGQIKSRVLSYIDGFMLLPHNDDNGERLLESVYYIDNDSEVIDSYDDTTHYRHIRAFNSDDDNGWKLADAKPHGFSEIPLITKRGKVAWDDVQNLIDEYERLYNIFYVIQAKHGWGILYIKGRIKPEAKRIAGSIILNDPNPESNGSVEFKAPPTPNGMLDTLQSLDEQIQRGASTTFLLPKDVKTSGDISGVAIQLTQSLDITNAKRKVIDWQNVADKEVRLFKEGLAKELVLKGENPTAITDFDKLNINAKFVVYRPQSESELCNNLATMRGAGLLSIETGLEQSPYSAPSEKQRLTREAEESLEEEKEIASQADDVVDVVDNNDVQP